MSNLEHFKTLRVSPKSNMAQIRRAYKALAKMYHPDKNRNESERDDSTTFTKIQEAYEELRKQHQRERNRKKDKSLLQLSMLERLQTIAELIDSNSSESSEEDYLLHRTLQARSLKMRSENLGKKDVQPTPSLVPHSQKLELIRQVLNSGLAQSNSSSAEDQPENQIPSQEQIQRLIDSHQDIFTICRPVGSLTQ